MALTLVGLLYIAVLIILTSAATGAGISHRYLRVLQAGMPAIIVLQWLDRISAPGAYDLSHWLYLGFAPALIAIMLLLIRFKSPWRLVERLIRASGLFAPASFDSRRPIHRLALLLMLCAFAAVFWSASAEGLMRDLLDSYSAAGSALLNLSTFSAMYVLLALLGVGWLFRRAWSDSLERLGLRIPTRIDLLAGITLGCITYLAVSLLTLLWKQMVPPSTFEWQTAAARQIFDSLSSSLLLGALLALLAAIGEETLFRGALQPVFGVVIVSLFFTTIHLQYAASPAMAIMFLVSLAFGLARACLSTTAAIISHFLYNLIPIVLANLA